MKKLTNLLKTILVQVLPIMIGVYLGLVANDWNESRKAEVLQKRLLETMKKEFVSNKEQIEHLQKYHQALQDSTRAYMERYSPEELLLMTPEKFMTDVWRGTQIGTLKNASYQTAMVTGALAEMDIDLAIKLSELDFVQKDFSATGEKYLNSMIQMDSGDNLHAMLRFLFSFTMDSIAFENALLDLYSKALNAIDKELGVK